MALVMAAQGSHGVAGNGSGAGRALLVVCAPVAVNVPAAAVVEAVKLLTL